MTAYRESLVHLEHEVVLAVKVQLVTLVSRVKEVLEDLK